MLTTAILSVVLVIGFYFLIAIVTISYMLRKHLDNFEMVAMCVLGAVATIMIIGSVIYPYFR